MTVCVCRYDVLYVRMLSLVYVMVLRFSELVFSVFVIFLYPYPLPFHSLFQHYLHVPLPLNYHTLTLTHTHQSLSLFLRTQPFFFNTVYDPYRGGSDFVRGFPYSMRAGVSTAVSHGLWMHNYDYDAPTQLLKVYCVCIDVYCELSSRCIYMRVCLYTCVCWCLVIFITMCLFSIYG